MQHRFMLAAVSTVGLWVALGLMAPTLAQSDDILSRSKAAIINDRAELASANRGSPRASLSAFLSQRGIGRSTIDSVVETARHTDALGREFARFEQRIDGLRVHGAYARVAFDAQGKLVHLIERIAPAGGVILRPGMDDAEALSIAVALNFGAGAGVPGQVGREGSVTKFEQTAFFHSSPRVERILIARGQGGLEEGFLVESWSEAENLLYHTLIDGRGRIVDNELRTAEDSYNVFPDHPGNSTQAVTSGPGSGNAESPSGWLLGTQRSTSIRGNNVHAYLDRDNNNAADSGGTPINDGNFIATADLTQQPTTASNQAVAVQNLFYLNNLIHDTLYRHGFVEAVGNFQNNNFTNGGAGNDAVNAEAQDGGGTNNANFATPSDGSSGRMQMYLWSTTSPQRDGDLDSDIVWHEYGHGLTWRMIGGMSGPISGAIGEGMSDVLSLIQNDDDVVGEYSTNDASGIRSAPYTNYGRTLGDFGGSSVHFDGEIYAATIWFLKGLYNDDDLLLTDLVGGMNFTPSTPTYPEMREGILAQVAARSADVADQCRVWEAFAQFGIGDGASMSVKGGGPFGGGKVNVSESFALPTNCSDDPPPPPPPPPSGDVLLTGFSGSSAAQGRNRWRATVTAEVNTEGAVVDVVWSDGSATSCTISGGSCSMSTGVRNNVSSITAEVTLIDEAAVVADVGVPTSVTLNRP